MVNERCPQDGKYMGLVGESYWSCSYCGKIWNIVYSKAGARIASEIAPSPGKVVKISDRELMERIAAKIGVNVED